MTDVSVGIVGERTIIVGQRTNRFLMFLIIRPNDHRICAARCGAFRIR